MPSFRRLAFLLAFTCAATTAAFPQSSSSSTADPSQSPNQASPDQASPAQQSNGESQGQLTVQARIRQRRLQRRATAIHDAYDHRWEIYEGMGYLRFTPGPSLQRLTWYSWDTGLTRYSSERLGFTLDARGYFGHAFVGLNESGFTRPEISQYDLMVGPIYRFYLQPKYSISGRVVAGGAYGNFEGDTNGFKNMCNLVPGQTGCLLYPSGASYAASASIVGEYNLTPSVAFKLAPEYFFTGFGSTVQESRGFTAGIVYRFGKQ